MSSEDIIGWSEFKRFNIRDAVDRAVEHQEAMNRARDRYFELINRQGSNNPLRDEIMKSFDVDWSVIRRNLIFINALREGLIQTEQRLSKIEEKLGVE